jgi:iron complex transport system ATP-binding protein
MTAHLEATSLTVRHPGAERDSVRDLHLSVERGEILCLAGPNGSGKSTTLAALGRELRPRAGSITLGGTPIWSIPRRAFAKKVARLPQEPIFPEGLTIEALVESGRYPYTGALRGLDHCDRRAVDEAISAMDLQHLRTRPMERLSGGERRRAWLAMVLCQRAEILLLDEPIASLDIRHRWEVLGHLARLNREWGVTMVIVMHELELAAALAHRIATFTRGRLYEVAHPTHALRGEMLIDVFGVEGSFHETHGSTRLAVHAVADPLRSL